MANKTWNTNRTGGGTYEFSQDAQGKYVLNSVGFQKFGKLNLPELKAEATKTTTTKDTKTASAQTKEAFGNVQPFYYQGGGRDASQYTTEYDMTKDKSLDTDQSMVAGDTFAQARQKMTTDDAYLGKPMTTGEGPWTMRSGKAPIDDNKSWEKVAESYTLAGQKDKDELNKVYKNMDDAHLLPGVSEQDVASVKQPDRFASGQWGPKSSKGMPVTPSSRQPGLEIANRRVSPQKPTVSETALKQINTASNTLSKTLGGFLKGGGIVGGVVRSIAGPPTATQTHAQGYFNVRAGDSTGQRIAGNPATDLYAGMNRVSMFGNLEKAGAKRIATREKTIAKYEGKWSEEKMNKFKETTNNMRDQQDSYTRDKHEAVAKDAVKKGADPMNPSEMRAASIKASNEKGNSGNGGNGGGRVICTELHSTGEMSTVDWVRDTRFTFKTLTKSHVKGYLFWAIPTVRHMKKYPLYRKIWKHIAQHRANDIAWRLGESKFDLLGRIYAGIGEPTCWLIGKFVSNKQYNELNLKNWRQA